MTDNRTPAARLTAALAAIPRPHRQSVRDMLELFDALTPRARRAWLAEAQAAQPKVKNEQSVR